MKERPIIFSGPMVRALLEGRKTQTRRVVKPLTDREVAESPTAIERVRKMLTSPYGVPGDRLWVRETWALANRNHWPDLPHIGSAVAGGVAYYRASFDRSKSGLRWRPSIHMPRWASRIALEVTDVRVQRLQDISAEDAKAEGAFWTDYGFTCHHGHESINACPMPDTYHTKKPGWSSVETTSSEQCLGSPQMAFASLWNSINGPDAWDANPWVWCIQFRRLP